jgi:hypothetical protein
VFVIGWCRKVEADNEKGLPPSASLGLPKSHRIMRVVKSQAATVSSNGPKNSTDEFELFDRRRLRPYSVVQVTCVFFERLSRAALLLSLVGSERLELR